jgi:hypothetical protein
VSSEVISIPTLPADGTPLSKSIVSMYDHWFVRDGVSVKLGIPLEVGLAFPSLACGNQCILASANVHLTFTLATPPVPIIVSPISFKSATHIACDIGVSVGHD